VLGLYLTQEPAQIELRFGDHGKPMLAKREEPLRFNLSHSGELALIAISEEREVGVDVQLIGSRPTEFYVEWTQREAVAKCHGTGLWAPPPDAAVAVTEIDTDRGYAAAVAIAGENLPSVRRFELEPP
jgi:4'-phosphopantetheinyl transferase